jgi:ATP-dependent DNA helicase RecG
MPDFRLANPIFDRTILEQAREDAFEIVQSDPLLRKAEHQGLNNYMQKHFKERMNLINIS